MMKANPLISSLAVVAGTLAFLCAVPDAAAQDRPPCEQVVELAETLYAQGRFDEVVSLVSECLNDEDVAVPTAVRGYRIMALALLRNDAVADARLAVIELLARDPSYIGDPIQDLPAYVALVANTREQLGLPEDPTADAEDPVDEGMGETEIMPSAAANLNHTQLAGDMAVRVRVGWSSYGGERGATGGGTVGEFVDNGGVAGSVELQYAVTQLFGVGLQYQFARYPTILDPKGSTPTPDFPAIDATTSSRWLHYVGLVARASVPTSAIVRPYASIGFFTSFGLLNDKVSVSGGPKFAAGVDVSVSPRAGLFMEFESQLLIPGDGSDLTDQQFSYDLFTGISVGTRYAIVTN